MSGRADYDSPPSTAIRFRLGHHLNQAAITDTRQRLPSKAIRRYALQILELAQLAGSVSRAQKRQVGAVYAVTVIRNLDELEAALFDRDLDTGRARIERVLEQLFDCIGRSVDDLSISAYCLKSPSSTARTLWVAMKSRKDTGSSAHLGSGDLVDYILPQLDDGSWGVHLAALIRSHCQRCRMHHYTAD